MLFTNIATVFALATMAQAFAIPSNPENGVYAVTIGEDGKEIHTKISDSTNSHGIKPDEVTPVNDLDGLERREHGRIYCGCGFNMNHGHTDRAVEKLVAQLTFDIIDPKMSFYSIDSDVVAFVCNRSPDKGLVLLGDSYRDRIADISGSCGRYIAGAYQTGDDGQAGILGYARYKKGYNFCAHATDSTSTSC